MTKLEFLEELKKGLNGLPQEDIEERINFYGEMIDDRIEDGIAEEEAVASIGCVENIVSQIVADVPLAKIVKQKITPKKKLSVGAIVLISLGSPIWASLLVALVAVALALYVSLWSVIISLWAVFVSLIACGLGGVMGGTVFCLTDNVLAGLWLIGAALVCLGLGILMFYGCKAVTKYFLIFTKKTVLWTKNLLLGKEEAK